ncbi:hypothetical protein Glove_80g18 [Diversispora epigaea]|uniref:Uncharacterized protein n=1 Tax=Diversispora epigaea TaxID=1348612 RepID=A0A397JH64_9GLOM|nr:hypothetical protein Glove_80g18 [Diversispora epigaea]
MKIHLCYGYCLSCNLPEKIIDCPCFDEDGEVGLYIPEIVVHCLECGYFFDYCNTNELIHNTNCSEKPKYSRRYASQIIQRCFRSWMKTRISSAKTIQQVVTPWLYRPDGPIARNALKRYYGLVTSQIKN